MAGKKANPYLARLYKQVNPTERDEQVYEEFMKLLAAAKATLAQARADVLAELDLSEKDIWTLDRKGNWKLAISDAQLQRISEAVSPHGFIMSDLRAQAEELVPAN